MPLESNFGVISTGKTARKVFPFYIVCDVSQSMWDPPFTNQPVPPLTVVEDALPDMLSVLEEDEVTCDTAHVCVITFGDRPEVVLPLTALYEDPAIRELPRQYCTNYAEVFSFLDKQLRHDQQLLAGHNLGYYTPVIYFLTDGNPQIDGVEQSESRWLPGREALGATDHPFRPLIVALGIGAVTASTVRKLRSTRPTGVACVAETGAVPSDLLRAIMHSIQFSMSLSTRGEFEFEVPAGMRRLD